MNYTLKQLTSMPFEDWAALIQIETMVDAYNYNEGKMEPVIKREERKCLNTIDLSHLKDYAIDQYYYDLLKF